MIKQEDTGYSVTATIKQVRILIEDVTDLTMTDSLTDSGFTGIRLSGCETPGVIWVEGRLLNPNYLSLRLGLVHIDEKSQKNKISSFLDQLEKAGILERTDNDVTTRLNVSCEPMGPIRADQLKGKLVRLNDIASFLQKETNPLCGFRFNEIAEKYNGMSELLEGVMPIEKKFNIPESNWRKKVSEAITCLKAGICVATVFESRLLGTMFLRSIAACLLEAGETIGKYKGTSIVIKNLPDLISKAPGFVAMSAV